MKLSKKIFIINGYGGVGKDTFCEYVGHYAKVKVISSIDLVKEYATKMGWDGGKTPKDRKFLSDLKDLLTGYNDYPYRDMCQKVLAFKDSDDEFLFIHIREPEEIERAKKEFSAYTVLVTNDSADEISSNHADAEVFNYSYDLLVDNSGTLEELDLAAKYFVENVRKGNLK